ncbi:hypothetical protein Pyn_32181 [Prunus yedoensis var. nudiflora]|uniref:Uncharacterized protein n=1 Tax=Prunus yedoensis var. nudiflora TaxID=2094558 RepID=A0A314UF35_PRUYE|nr:hypothetical protein Pyn_32181 [Prunus yedoensis var. nudiflora]
MWSAFFAYSLVEATGSTFFFEQLGSLDTQSGIESVMDVAVFFILVSRSSSFLVSFIYDLLIPKQWRKAMVTLVRIGCGLACSMLCCVAAWLVEGKRMKSRGTDQIIDGDKHETFAMSTWWLIPQFVLLGLMQGLALNGLTEFLADRIANNDRLRARKTKVSSLLEEVEQGIHAAKKEADVEEDPVGGADLENNQTAQEQVEQEIDDDDERVWTSETTKEIRSGVTETVIVAVGEHTSDDCFFAISQ